VSRHLLGLRLVPTDSRRSPHGKEAAQGCTAVAGPDASTSAVSKKKVKKIATKRANKQIDALVPSIADERIDARAPGLSVKHAATANSAHPTGAAGGDLTGAYPSPRLAGGAVSASSIGTIPLVGATTNANQGIPNGGNHLIDWSTDTFDTASMHVSSAPTRFTAPIAGIYEVDASVAWSGSNAGSRTVRVLRNGTPVFRDRVVPTLGEELDQSVHGMLVLGVGQFVELSVNQTSGINPLNIQPGTSTQATYMNVGWLGPLTQGGVFPKSRASACWPHTCWGS
jgi:hypothetical protein